MGFGCGVVCCRGWGEGEGGLGEEDEGDGKEAFDPFYLLGDERGEDEVDVKNLRIDLFCVSAYHVSSTTHEN